MITKLDVFAADAGVTNSTCQNWSGGSAPLTPRSVTRSRITRLRTGSSPRSGYKPAIPTCVTSLNGGVVGSASACEATVSGIVQLDPAGEPPVLVTATGKCCGG